MNIHVHPARWPGKEIFCEADQAGQSSWVSIGQRGEWSVTLFARDGLTARDIADVLAGAMRQFEHDDMARDMAPPWPPQPIPANAANRPLTGAEVSRALGEQP